MHFRTQVAQSRHQMSSNKTTGAGHDNNRVSKSRWEIARGFHQKDYISLLNSLYLKDLEE